MIIFIFLSLSIKIVYDIEIDKKKIIIILISKLITNIMATKVQDVRSESSRKSGNIKTAI